jgi:hypothetical protein
MENLIDFDYISMPPVPSYYELEQIVIQQQRKMDEMSIIIKKIQSEIHVMRENKMKLVKKLESKVIEVEDKIKDDIRLRNDMTIKVEVLEQLNNLMVTFYYIDLHDVTNHVKKFQRETESKIFVHDVKHLQNANELFLKKEKYFNATIELNKDNDIDGLLDVDFMRIPNRDVKLMIKKIEIAINSEKVDISNKIILNFSEIQKFYNLKKIKLCRLRYSYTNELIYISPIKLKEHHALVRFFRCSPNGKYLDKETMWIVE